MLTLPHCYETEKGLLGAFLTSEYNWNADGFGVDPEHIYNTQIQEIITWMQEENCCDLSIIHDKFTNCASLLAECMENPTIRCSAAIKVIDETFCRRETLKLLHIAQKGVSRGNKSTDTIMSTLIENCSDLGRLEGSVSHIADIIPEAKTRLEARSAGEVVGLSTGLKDLDKKICGFAPGELIIIAGRPSMGKTALACNIVAKQPVVSLVFSLEMTRAQIVSRFIASEGEMPYSEYNENRMARASLAIENKGIYVDDTPGVTLGYMVSRCKRIQRQFGLGLVVIDHAQLIGGSGSPLEIVSAASSGLKKLAKEMDCPVVLVSQLNRKCEIRPDKRPMLSDLRDSGTIEQDADKAILMYRPEYYNPNDSPGVAEAIVAKHRDGPTGIVNLTYRKEIMKFEDYHEADVW